MKNNETVFSVDAEDQESLEQAAVLLVRETNIESYTCVAHNMMGSSTCALHTRQLEGNAIF